MAKRALRRLIPYWLRRGERTCHECHGMHAYAVEVRCAGCDRGYCPLCVVFIEGEPLCPQCSKEA